MLRTLYLSISDFLFRSVRSLYWIYRLGKIQAGTGLKIKTPVIIEGNGSVKLGNDCHFGKSSSLGIEKKSSLVFENDFSLGENAVILMGKQSKFTGGNGVQIGAGTRIYINKDWVWGDEVVVATNCQLFSRESGHAGSLHIGKGTHIGDGTIIDVTEDVVLGKHVAFGPNCTIYTHDHIYDKDAVAAWDGAIMKKSVMIEDGAWIGSGVTILPGVKIGKKAIVAAGAVVTTDVNEKTLVGGVPAKLLKNLE